MSIFRSILLFGVLCVGFAHAQGTVNEFRQGDESFAARVVEGRVAIILDEAVLERTGRSALLGELSARPLPGLPPNIVSIPTNETSELELKRFASDYAFERDDIVRGSGVLVQLGQADDFAVMTNEIIVQLAERGDKGSIEEIAQEFDARIIGSNPFEAGQFVLAVSPEQSTLDVSNKINDLSETIFAHPNFYMPVQTRQTAVIPNDTFFGDQWHLDNTGQSGGTPDADIDADLAWFYTTGTPDVIIAVIDDAFEIDHPDLVAGLWSNTGETAGDGIDNDGNGFVDDANGWDFTACVSVTPCGDADPSPGTFDDHGTAVAGAALARQDNALGVSGTCPDCTFMPLRALNGPVFAHALAFGYAEAQGADIITNSWGYRIGMPTTAAVETAINSAATNGRGGLGAVVLFAMNNISVDDCIGATPDISSIATVIGVSRATNQDRFSSGGYGDCMDVLGPTRGGTLDAVTTDRQGAPGYNNGSGFGAGCAATEPTTPPNSNADYTFCFGGTSFATPVTAGVVGLMLSLDDSLTRLEVQRILQDTADKTEHSLGAYDPETGFSDPAASTPTHGYGRINAFEAVRLVADRSEDGARGGVDLVIRDNVLDWGNTEQPSNTLMEPTRGYIPHWRSVDIKVDAPPFAATPTTSAQFDAFVHENPQSSTTNRVYVRVRNRGPETANDVEVKLHWAFAGAGLPALPSDFWTQFPMDSTNTSIWHPVGLETVSSLPYSGTSVAGGASDAAAVVSFDFAAPAFDASLPNPDHYCLFAVVSSPDDPVETTQLVPDIATPRDNNVTHRNVKLMDSGRSDRFTARLMLNNPFDRPILTWLATNRLELFKVQSEGVQLFERIELEPGDGKMVELEIASAKPFASGEVEIRQMWVDEKSERPQVLGGQTYEIAPRQRVKIDLDEKLLVFAIAHQKQIEQFQKLAFSAFQFQRSARSGTDARVLEQIGNLLEGQGRLLERMGVEARP